MRQWHLIILAFLGSCISPQKYYHYGYYHEAAVAAISKLQRQPNHSEYVRILQQAYPKAVREDKEKIAELRQHPTPESYEEIYHIYDRMYKRQKLLETVLPLSLQGQRIQFPLEDFKAQRLSAEKRWVGSYYKQALKLLKSGKKQDARKAYILLEEKVAHRKYWFPQYDSLLGAARKQGIVQVNLRFVNRSHSRIEPEQWRRLSTLPWPYNDQWMSITDDSAQADVLLQVDIQGFQVGAVETHEKEYVFSDKDSTGSRSATVTEHRRQRTAQIKGTIKYIVRRTGRRIWLWPFEHLFVEERKYYTYQGDLSIVPSHLHKAIKEYDTIRPLPSRREMQERMLNWLIDFVTTDLQKRRVRLLDLDI